MNLKNSVFVLISILLFSYHTNCFATDQEEESTGYITGVVTSWTNYIPKGASVLVVGTSNGSMTDSSGTYFISVEPGHYSLMARMIGMPSALVDNVIVQAGDTTFVDIVLEYPILRYEWPGGNVMPMSGYPVYLHLIGNSEQPTEGLTVRSGRVLCHTAQLSKQKYLVHIPHSSVPFRMCLPYTTEFESDSNWLQDNGYTVIEFDLPEIQQINDLEPGLNVIADYTRNEWIAPGYTYKRILIDPYRYGNSKLKNNGLVTVGYDLNPSNSAEEWRVILVYCDRVVVVTDKDEPVTWELCFPCVRTVYMSPGCRYILAYDAIGDYYESGDVVLLDTVTGRAVRFDPSPEMKEIPGTVIRYVVEIRILGITLLSDSGYVCILEPDNTMKLFDPSGQLCSTRNLNSIDLSLWNIDRNHFWLSPDGSRIIALTKPEDENHSIRSFNRDFQVVSKIDIGANWRINTLQSSTDRNIGLLVRTNNNNDTGVYVFNTRLGGSIQEWNADASSPFMSSGGEMVAYYEENRIILRETYSGNILYEISADLYWDYTRIIDVGDDGSCLIFLGDYGEGSAGLTDIRLAYYSGSGDLIWLGPARSYLGLDGRYDVGKTFDDRLQIVYVDGRYINMLTFMRE